MTAQHLAGLAAIDLADIKPSPNNPRDRLNDIEGLAVSIRENGLIQPLVVQRIPGQDHFQIVAGHRRFVAVRSLGWAKVPCVIRRDMLPDEELLAMLVENGQRSGLDPMEEAHALSRLRKSGLSKQDMARRVGRSLAWAEGRLMLLELSPAEQEEVRAGHYTLQHAHQLVRTVRAGARKATQEEPRPLGRPKGRKTTPYFSDKHPLAGAVRAACGHRGPPKVGGVGCGPCWESAIRSDAVGSAATAAEVSTDSTDDESEKAS